MCGKDLYHESSLIVRGVWYCLDRKCRPAELEPKQVLLPVSADITRKNTGFFSPSLTVRLLVTLALCLIVLTAVVFREMARMKAEIAVLRESRFALIDLFRNQNHDAAGVSGGESDSLSGLSSSDSSTVEVSSPPETLKPRVADGPVRQYRPATEIPYSVANGPLDQKRVSFTFDGGSMANVAGEVLDTLASRSVKATMFLTGFFMRKYPDVVRRIVAEGHECGNHTIGHLHLTTYAKNSVQATLPQLTEPVLADQLRRAEQLFHSITGSSLAPLWRAPYGEFNGELCRWGYNAGYVHVAWRQGRRWRDGLDSNDWIPDSTVPGYRTPREFLDKITKIASLPPPGLNGGIILMHLGTERKDPALRTHRLLGTVIDTLRAQGFSIVPVSQLVTAKGFDLASLEGRSDIQ